MPSPRRPPADDRFGCDRVHWRGSVNALLASLRLETVRGIHHVHPVFIAEASSNHGLDLGGRWPLSRARRQRLRRRQSFSSSRSTGCSRRRFSRARASRPQGVGSCLYASETAGRRCRDRSIRFSCTPFYVEAVDRAGALRRFLTRSLPRVAESRRFSGLRAHGSRWFFPPAWRQWTRSCRRRML
jgi:hypothetical protein